MRIATHSGGFRQRAFSLLELLVVIGILATVLALLLPAVQKAREAVYVIRCQNNLRQIGIALTQFHTAHNVFPSNGGWDGRQTIPAVNGPAFTPSTFDYTTNDRYQWGVGDPMKGPTEQTGSWAYSILPYVEQEMMYRKPDWTAPVPLYICPLRRPADAVQAIADDGYGKYDSGGWTWGKIDYAVNLSAFDNRPTCRNTAIFADGLSFTFLAGEKAFHPLVEQPNSWYWDEPFFLGGSKGTSRGGVALLHDNSGNWQANPYKDNWGSPHSWGVHFLFGDGAVRSISRTIDQSAFVALMTPDGGEEAILP